MDIVKTLKKILSSAPIGKNGKPESQNQPENPELPKEDEYW